VDRHGALLGPLASQRLTLVAGSTWPSDEDRLFPAIVRARAALPALRCIIAPHEPSAAVITTLQTRASSMRLEARPLGHPFAGDADLIIVDRVGVLGDLYALADIAFVGGGFHSAGLHSVLEPAAYGAPVLFGPQHVNSREAMLLEREGGGASVADEAALSAALSRWSIDGAARADAGHRARSLVERGLGATDRTVVLLERLLDLAKH
jgi:3-deoxy-D-manno-octulosonic-acid transferase